MFDPKVIENQIINDLSNHFDSLKVKSSGLLDNLTVYDSLVSAITKSDIIAIMTEWEMFKNINYSIANENFDLIDGRFFINE